MNNKLFLLMMGGGLVCVGSAHAMWRSGAARIAAGALACKAGAIGGSAYAKSDRGGHHEGRVIARGLREARLREEKQKSDHEGSDVNSVDTKPVSVVDACYGIVRACKEGEGSKPSDFMRSVKFLEKALAVDQGGMAGYRGLHILGEHLGSDYYEKCHALEKGVSLLLKSGVDTKFVLFGTGDTLIKHAVYGNSAELVRLFARFGVDVNETSCPELSPLWYALKDSKFEVAKVLLELGAKQKRADFLYVRDRKTADLLIKHGAKINAVDKDGSTLLMDFVEDGNLEVVEALLYHGAKTTVRDENGRTALDKARRQLTRGGDTEAHLKIAQLLSKYPDKTIWRSLGEMLGVVKP